MIGTLLEISAALGMYVGFNVPCVIVPVPLVTSHCSVLKWSADASVIVIPVSQIVSGGPASASGFLTIVTMTVSCWSITQLLPALTLSVNLGDAPINFSLGPGVYTGFKMFSFEKVPSPSEDQLYVVDGVVPVTSIPSVRLN